MDLSVYLTSQMVGVIVVFCRIGSAMIFMPGFGETQISMRFKLIFAIVLSLALYAATPIGPLQFNTWLQFVPIVAIEITIGLWIGLTARIIMTALQFAGYQIGLVSGLANVFAPNMNTFQGATVIASALLMLQLTVTTQHGYPLDSLHIIRGRKLVNKRCFYANLSTAIN